jgi:hypothetical protein
MSSYQCGYALQLSHFVPLSSQAINIIIPFSDTGAPLSISIGFGAFANRALGQQSAKHTVETLDPMLQYEKIMLARTASVFALYAIDRIHV